MLLAPYGVLSGLINPLENTNKGNKMDTLKYIESACSKDKTRFNINAVYRDKNHLVGMDGHIMHYTNGLPDMEPHFLNGQDGQFPDWKQALPSDTKEIASIDYYAYRSLLPFLKACASINKKGATIKLEKNHKNKLSFSFDQNGYKFSYESEIEAHEEVLPCAYDANLLLICLKPLEKDKKIVSTLNIADASAPMEIRHNSYDFHANAVIMPMRFE